MRTILKDEDGELEISDEEFDSPLSWLKLTMRNVGGGDSCETEIEIPLRELMGAIIGFDAKRNRFEEEVKDE